jgi:hypothetical protein
MSKKDKKLMLLDEYDVDEMFSKKCHCFGAAFTAAGGGALMSGGTAVAANLSLVGTLVSMGGSIMQGQAAADQARFQAGVANNNAIVAQQQATRAAQQAKIDEDDFRRQQSDLFASRRSLFGKTNINPTTGSPLAVSSDFAGESELNALRVRNQGAVNVNALQNSVRQQQSQAGLFATKGRNAVRSSAFRAGGQLFSGASTINKIYRGTE